MRFLYLLPIVIAVIAVTCSRKETVEPRRIAMPATCGRMHFDAAIEQLEAIAGRRDEILGRADSYPASEPAEFARRVQLDEVEFRELPGRADAVFMPRCLQAAKEIYGGYLDKSRIALEARRPGDDPSTFRQKRETADTVYGQFRAEVAAQRRNAQ